MGLLTMNLLTYHKPKIASNNLSNFFVQDRRKISPEKPRATTALVENIFFLLEN